MRLIIGLGNPGPEYEGTRHNLGFAVVERVAALAGTSGWKEHLEARILKGHAGSAPFMLAQPQTFMNASGRAVAALMRYYKIEAADILVITDDLDLAPGKVRLRMSGSDGGHKGLRSITEHLGTPDFKRIRLGIGRPTHKGAVVSFVLAVDKETQEELDNAVEEAARQVMAFIQTGGFENHSIR